MSLYEIQLKIIPLADYKSYKFDFLIILDIIKTLFREYDVQALK